MGTHGTPSLTILVSCHQITDSQHGLENSLSSPYLAMNEGKEGRKEGREGGREEGSMEGWGRLGKRREHPQRIAKV